MDIVDIAFEGYGDNCPEHNVSDLPLTCFEKIRIPYRVTIIRDENGNFPDNNPELWYKDAVAYAVSEFGKFNIELYNIDISPPTVNTPIEPDLFSLSLEEGEVDEDGNPCVVEDNAILDFPLLRNRVTTWNDALSTELNRNVSPIQLIFTNRICTCSGNCGATGVASFPGMEPAFVAVSALSEYPEKTLVHELGHLFGLFHTFQDFALGVDDCVGGDRIEDTPPAPQEFSDCMSGCNFISGCLNLSDLEGQTAIENYMSYNGDCRNSFTPYQMRKMWDIAAQNAQPHIYDRPDSPSIFRRDVFDSDGDGIDDEMLTFVNDNAVVFFESCGLPEVRADLIANGTDNHSNTGNCVEWYLVTNVNGQEQETFLNRGPILEVNFSLITDEFYTIRAYDVPPYNTSWRSAPAEFSLFQNHDPSCFTCDYILTMPVDQNNSTAARSLSANEDCSGLPACAACCNLNDGTTVTPHCLDENSFYLEVEILTNNGINRFDISDNDEGTDYDLTDVSGGTHILGPYPYGQLVMVTVADPTADCSLPFNGLSLDSEDCPLEPFVWSYGVTSTGNTGDPDFLPTSITSSFQTGDVVYASMEILDVYVDVRLTIQIFDPNGALVESFFYDTEPLPSGQYYIWYRAYTSTVVNKSGQWRVDFYANEPGAGLEFQESAYFTVTDPPADCLTVTNTNDSGPGSLREAINCANDNPGADYITFDISGNVPLVIQVNTALPTISGTTIIDGSTQPGYPGNQIEIRAPSQNFASGLTITGADCEIYGLKISQFGRGINLPSNNDIVATIGGVNKGNYFFQNGTGIWVSVLTTVATNPRVVVKGNQIEGNGTGRGINLQTSNNTVGGIGPGEGNQIWNYAEAVCHCNFAGTNNLIRGNQIFCNDEGITPSNSMPPSMEVLPNNRLGGAAAPNAIIDLYQTDITACPQHTACQGAHFLGTTVAGSDGNWAFNLQDIPLEGDPVITATATETGKSTSAFSDCLALSDNCDGETFDLAGTLTTNIMLRAQNYIHTSEFIGSGLEVSYTAGNEIRLLPGAYVQAGAVFYARIEDCQTTALVQAELPPESRMQAGIENTLELAPNPFRQQVRLSFELPAEAPVDLRIYNATGREVAVLVSNEVYPAGRGQWTFSGQDHPPGMYLVRLEVGGRLFLKKMILMR